MKVITHLHLKWISRTCGLLLHRLLYVSLFTGREKFGFNIVPVSYMYLLIALTNYPTTWSQNQNVHHSVHKTQPLIHVLSQLNSIHSTSTPAILLKINSDPILPSTPRSSEWCPSFGHSHQNLLHFSLLPCVPYVQPTPRSLISPVL
jgi:Na+-translocating ferredoxin:NAD+ oxidoreductase RnfD subunit